MNAENSQVHSGANTLSVLVGGVSLGGVKNVNEDAFAVHQPEVNERVIKGVVACMADGASCSQEAQLASQTSVTNFIEDYYSTPDSWSVKESAAKILSSLNSWLFTTGNTGAHPDSLVTTFSAVILKSSTLHTLHVGDSRIYRLRDGNLHHLSRDHTRRYMGTERLLTRALGMDSHLEVDYSSQELQVDDLLILTTDGLHEFISDEELQCALVSSQNCLEDTARELTDLALAHGSDDNLSCLIIKVLTLPLEEIDEVHRQLTQLVIPPVMEPGVSIDDFKVIRVLYSGTRSYVYLVEGAGGDKFSLKAPSFHFSEDPLYLESFLREEWVGRRMNHHSVMKIYPRPDSSPYLYHLCEYIDGQTLRQWMLDNPDPPLEKVRELIKSIVIAVRAFQRMSMVHRDIKPENLMLCPNRTVKVIDFGSVQVSGLQEVNTILKENVPQGSVNYTSPEYIQNGVAQSASDLYSLGVIAYEMLCGSLPYKEHSLAVEALNNRRWHYRSLRDKRPDIPLWIDLALEKALEPDPTKRQQAFSEFIQDLCVPNQALLKRQVSAPLLERNPTLFWKCTSALLLILLIASLLN